MRPGRWPALAAACSLTALAISVLPATPAAAASPAVTITEQASGSVLAGKPVSFTFTAANPAANAGAQPEYNASFRDVLPLGLTYQAHSTKPADLGDPTVITDPGNGQQTLVWKDIFDLPKGSSSSLTFSAAVNLPVGSTVYNSANAYASTVARYVPHFSAAGLPVADSRVQPATSNQSATVITALQLTRTEPNPEAKLLRGVHDQSTVYTLQVSNSSQASTTAVTVQDYLPASQEFLGCGQQDNTTAGAVEYPGASRLNSTPAVGANCLTPTSIDTVLNPPANGTVSYPPGVYTKISWTLGTLAAGQVSTIRYAAAIALKQNVLFSAGPSPASLGQAANLDNNTGAATRQLNDPVASVDYAHAAGNYTGPAVGGSAVVADTSHQVSVNDLRLTRSVAPSDFVAGAVTTYTLQLDSGEYTDNSAITITEVLPNGICPLDDLANHVSGAPAECAPAAGYAPSLPYQSVTQNADGSFTVVFQPVVVARNSSLSISYSGRDRASYTGGPPAGSPPAAGDSFADSATALGTSTPVAATGASGSQPVRDASSVTRTASSGSMSQSVAARTNLMDCSDPATSYGATDPVFAKGDRICFKINVAFSTSNSTRNAVLTDFLPAGTSYEDASVSYPAGNTVAPAQISFDTSAAAGGVLSWSLGANQPDGSTAVPAGSVLLVRFSALVVTPAAGPAPDQPGNVAKLRTTNSAGQAASLRAPADFSVAAAPPVAVIMGVSSVNGSGPNPANTDHVPVREGDSVVFGIEVSNNGSAANSNDVDIENLQLWDVLPAGIGCAQLAWISDSGACTDPGAPGQPSFSGSASLSAVVWDGAATPALSAGTAKTYQYALTVPSGVSVSTVFSGTAAVRAYAAGTDQSSAATFYPAGNIDTTVAAGSYDAPAADDLSDIYLRNVSVTNGVISAVNETGNLGGEVAPASSSQATIGEQLSWTVTARVPAGSTLYNASFADPLPTGLSLVSAEAAYTADAGLPADQPLPAGVSFDPAVPSLQWPAGYDNNTGTDQLFRLTITGQLAALAGNSNGVVRTNTATFTSATAATGGTALPARTAGATVTDVEPAPALSKTNDAGGGVSGGQSITYTLKATNAASRPPLHDSWLADCLPAGMTFAGYAAPPAGLTSSPATPGDGSNGCPVGTTLLSWNAGDLAGGSSVSVKYTATVDPSTSGKASYLNSASVTGNSLAGTRTSAQQDGNPFGRLYSAAATNTVTAAGATALKSVSPTSATVGDTVSYTTSAVLPAGINFYNLSLIDQLPAGIDPNSVVPGSVSCTNADGTGCLPASAVRLAATAGTGSSTVIGWLFGDVAFTSQTRTVALHYTARIADVPAATAGSVLTNSLHVGWDNLARTPPTSSGAAYQQLSPTVTAAVTVLEPGLLVAKAVSRLHPEPGQSFSYTVTVSNRATAGTSAAFKATVTDTVPTGVVVDPASISGGGSISGANPSTGGGVLSWTLPGPIAKGASMPGLTYTAALAPSASVTGAALVNTARITGYDSLVTGGRHYTGPSATATITPFFPKATTTKSTPGGSTGYIGESFPWLVTVRDTGSGVAYQLACGDTLPPNWTYDLGSARVSIGGGTAVALEPAVSTSGGVQTLNWTGLGTLNPGVALTISYSATPQPGVSGSPGVGIAVNHTNSATSSAQDATGATGNGAGSYTAGPGSAIAHIASADLSLTEAVGVAPLAGGSGSWTLTVRNSGPNAAVGPFTVTDQFTNPLPSGISSVSASGPGWSCTNAAPLSCQRTSAGDTLASGASFPVLTLSYSVAESVAGGSTLTNTATLSARTQDPDPADNTVTATATVRAAADLTISTNLISPQLVAGAPASYDLAVTNLGPSSAAGPITVDDPLPAGTRFLSVSGSGWSCTPIAVGTVGASLHCSLPGPLGVGAVPPALTVTVGIPSGQAGQVTDTASVSSPTPDPNPADDYDVQTDTALQRADLLVQTRHLSDPFVAGGQADYEIEVRNAGESDAVGVQVSDSLPAGLSYDSFSSSDPNWFCSAAGHQVSCGYSGSLAAGISTALVLSVRLAPDFSGPVLNSASVSAGTPDPVPGNNLDADDSSVSQLANLSISTTSGPSPTAGGPLTFGVQVVNSGPSDVTGPVTVTDALPAGLSFGSTSGTGWSCSYATATRVLTCGLSAGLAAGGTASPLSVLVCLDPDVGPATLDNTATVSSATSDPDLADNSSTDSIQVLASAALSVHARLSTPAPVPAGTSASFVLSAGNAGPSDATAVSVTDTLPAGLSYQSYTGTGWTCSAAGQSVVCTRDRLAAAATAPDLVLRALVSPSVPVSLPAGTATLVNNATIDSSTSGTRTNSAPVDVAVQAEADLALGTTAQPGEVLAGQGLAWRLAVSNSGPSDAGSPITVTDTLPGYQSFLSAGGDWSCVAGPAPALPSSHQVVTCTLNQLLAAGESAPPLDLLVQVHPQAPAGSWTNQATASSLTPGASGNGSASVTVGKRAALSLVLLHTGLGQVGEPTDFTLQVHNTGPSAADQIVISDRLPAGLSFVSGTGPGWSCAADHDQLVSCALADPVPAGADGPDLVLSTLVGAAAYPAATNVATLSSTDAALPDTAEAADELVINPAARLSINNEFQGNFRVGEHAGYLITVGNSGPTASPGPLRLTDSLPDGLRYLSATGTGWNCAATGQLVTCLYDSVLPVTGTTSLTLSVQVNATAYPAVTTTATVAGPGSGPVSSSDTAEVAASIVLRLAKTLTSYADGKASYRLAVTNSGPNATVAPILVTDPLPAGLSYMSASGRGWSCAVAGKLVSCSYSQSLLPGSVAPVTLVTMVSGIAGTAISNVASVRGGGGLDSAGILSNVAALEVSITGGQPGHRPPAASGHGSSSAAGHGSSSPAGHGSSSPAGHGSAALPQTGRNLDRPASTALLLLVAGMGLLALSRRRRVGRHRR